MLLETFANQAVIAIENARLFTETEQALERQTAAAEVLSVISSSLTDAKPVFDRIVASCERLLATDHVAVWLLQDDGDFHLAAIRSAVVDDFVPVTLAGNGSLIGSSHHHNSPLHLSFTADEIIDHAGRTRNTQVELSDGELVQLIEKDLGSDISSPPSAE